MDMAWDENEDHVIVAFGNGAMAMLDFGGFDGQQGNWRFLYDS
jgi:glycerol uptake facilitator-like aquaporin